MIEGDSASVDRDADVHNIMSHYGQQGHWNTTALLADAVVKARDERDEFREALLRLRDALVAASPQIDALIGIQHLRYSGDFDGDTGLYKAVYEARLAADALLAPPPQGDDRE